MSALTSVRTMNPWFLKVLQQPGKSYKKDELTMKRQMSFNTAMVLSPPVVHLNIC